MRRHRDIDVGLAPVAPQHMGNPVYAGLGSGGFGWSDSAVGDAAKNKLATSYMSTATADPALGSEAWKFLRSKWYDVLSFDGWDNDEPKMQKSRVQDINDKITEDTANPSFTDWDNTALGKFFGSTITDAKSRANWTVYKPDANNTNFGNRLALLCYKKNKPDLWPQIYQYMSTTPTRMFKEHLDTLGIANPTAKPVKFWESNPNFDYKLAAGVTASSTPKTQEIVIQPPPFDYGKLNATGLALRDGPSASASSIKTLPNPPLYAKVIGVSGGFVKVQLMDGTIGWTASGSDTKAYWLPSSQDEAFGNKQTVVTTNQNVPATRLTTGDGTTVTQYQDPNAGLPVPVAPVSPEPLVTLVAPVAPAPPETSNTAMYIGVGVGVLVIGGLALMLLKKKD